MTQPSSAAGHSGSDQDARRESTLDGAVGGAPGVPHATENHPPAATHGESREGSRPGGRDPPPYSRNPNMIHDAFAAIPRRPVFAAPFQIPPIQLQAPGPHELDDGHVDHDSPIWIKISCPVRIKNHSNVVCLPTSGPSQPPARRESGVLDGSASDNSNVRRRNPVATQQSPFQSYAGAIAGGVLEAFKNCTPMNSGIPVIDENGCPRPINIEVDAGIDIDGEMNLIGPQEVVEHVWSERKDSFQSKKTAPMPSLDGTPPESVRRRPSTISTHGVHSQLPRCRSPGEPTSEDIVRRLPTARNSGSKPIRDVSNLGQTHSFATNSWSPFAANRVAKRARAETNAENQNQPHESETSGLNAAMWKRVKLEEE